MKRPLAIAVAVTTLVAGVVLSPPAAAAPPATQSIVINLRTVVAFDYAAGEIPENITLNPDGTETVSLLGSPANERPELVRVDHSGRWKVLFVGQLGDTITGNTSGYDGTIYFNVWSADASRAGVWRIPVGGFAQRLAALPADGLPNGLTIDPTDRTLYVSDSYLSTIWAIPTSGGLAKAWLVDSALRPLPTAQPPLGANGMRYHDGAVWTTNFSLGTFLRVPVTATGAPGSIQTVATGLPGIDDFNFLSSWSDVAFVAVNSQNKVVIVYPNGHAKVTLDGDDGVRSPTSTALRGTSLYITEAGNPVPHTPQLQEGTINIPALLAGAAS